jgi:hypothetical protein
MKSIQALFTNEIEIEINQKNETYFSILAEKFSNNALNKVIRSFSPDNPPLYSLSFDILTNVSLNIFQNFTLIVNKTLFRTNLFYLCCISKLIFNAFLQQPNLITFKIEIKHEKENEIINCISSFLNFINGNEFSFEGFHSDIFFHVIDKLDINGFEDILLQLYPVPITFKEATKFLQFNFAPSLPIHSQRSLEIVSSKFYKFNLSNTPTFSVETFESILLSSKLKIINETTLFQIILNKIKADSNYNCLLKHVHFAFVKSDLLINFLSEMELTNFDLSSFREIKKGLIELKLPLSQVLAERWKESPIILSES